MRTFFVNGSVGRWIKYTMLFVALGQALQAHNATGVAEARPSRTVLQG